VAEALAYSASGTFIRDICFDYIYV